MSIRLHPIVQNQIYHVFNRSVASQPIFLNKRDYQRFLETINFYRFSDPGVRFSFYDRFNFKKHMEYIQKLEKEGEKQISVYAFCLMPNHFHFILKDLTGSGIKNFSRNIQNSYAKYFNIKNKRNGSLFQEMFKAVRIETDEQFLHTVRYVHLNPYSSYVIEKIEQLDNYPWSSFSGYLNNNCFNFIDYEFLNSFYTSKEKFKSFTFDQADYQKQLNEYRYFLIDPPEV